MRASGVICLEIGDMTGDAMSNFADTFPDQRCGLTGLGCKHIFDLGRLGYNGPWELSTMYLCMFSARCLLGIGIKRLVIVYFCAANPC